MRGPRSGIIFYKKHLKDNIDFAVFPGLQGGPHNHQIAGLANQLLEVTQPSFKEYIKKVKSAAKTLAEYFKENGYNLVSDGTDNHLILINLANKYRGKSNIYAG